MSIKILRTVVCFLVTLCAAGMCFGQDDQDNKSAKKAYNADYLPRFIAFYGNGINKQARPTGGGGSANPQKLTNLGIAVEGFELGLLAPTDEVGTLDGFFLSSGYTYYPQRLGKVGGIRFDLPLTLGYTRMIGTANAINFGVGFDALLSKYAGIRFEVRDYFKLFGHKEHNVIFRVAVLRLFED